MKKLSNVQVLRGLAALAVVVFHARDELDGVGIRTRVPALFAGAFGVDVFFVISGLVMVYASVPMFGTAASVLPFMGKRLARIVPLYWVVTALFVLLDPTTARGDLGRRAFAGFIALSLAFTPYLWPTNDDSNPIYPLGWTLDYEIFFYLCFALVLVMPRRTAVAALAGSFLALVVLCKITPVPNWLFYLGSTQILEFVAGMGIAGLALSGVQLRRVAALVLIASGLIAMLVAIPWSDDWWGEWRGVVWGIPAAAIVGGMALHPPKRQDGLLRLWCERLGDASYSLYLVHYALYVAVEAILRSAFDLTQLPAVPFMLLLVGLAVATGFVVHRGFEVPVTRLLRRRRAFRPFPSLAVPVQVDRPRCKRVGVSQTAQASLVVVGVVLLAPTLAMTLQSTESLEQFHNRVLTPWPKVMPFVLDPARYFKQANRWLGDRVYPIISTTYFRNNFVYFALHASPAANVTVGQNGFVFLNGTDADAENDLVTSACAQAADPGQQTALTIALDRLADFGRRHNYSVDVVMVPTVPVLYGDRLPRSFPSALREACRAGPMGRAPLSRIRAPEGLSFVYPFEEMSALRDDPAMFPIGNFHPDGLSVKIVTDRYLTAIGAPLPALSVMPTSAPSEVLAEHGVIAPFPLYAVTGSSAVEDEGTTATVLKAVRPFYDDHGEAAYVYRDGVAADPQTVLMLSDSYGYNQGISFAAAFRTVVQMPAPDHDLAGLVQAVGALVHFDRLVLVFNDSNFGRLIDLGALLPAPVNPCDSHCEAYNHASRP